MRLEDIQKLEEVTTEGIVISGVSRIIEAHSVLIHNALCTLVKTAHCGVERYRVLKDNKVVYASCKVCNELLERERFMVGKKGKATCKKCANRLKEKRKISATKQNTISKPFNYECPYCTRSLTAATTHIEHFIPRSKGGSDELSNLLACCAYCNLAKSDLDFFDWSKDYFSHNSVLTPYQVQIKLVNYFKTFNIDYSDRINVG